MISARLSTKSILLLPLNHLPTNTMLHLSSKRNMKIAFALNNYPRASSDDHRRIIEDSVNVVKSVVAGGGAGAGASISMACVLGLFCFGAALMGSPSKAAAWRIPNCVSGGGGGGGGENVVDSENKHKSINPFSQKDIVISLSKVKRFFDQKDMHSSSKTIKDFDLAKQNALKQIKNGNEDIYKVLEKMMLQKEMKKTEPGVGSYDINIAALEIHIAQGNFDKAFTTLKLLEKESYIKSDLRLLLYKAIIYSIKYDKDNSPVKYWEEFFEDNNLPQLPE